MTPAAIAALSTALGLMVALAAGCIVRDSPTDDRAGLSDTVRPASSVIDAVADADTPPMVVGVQTGATLVAAPGAGVGVFTDYKAGGHWRVRWTCDTNATGQPCAYQVAVSTPAGALSNLEGVGLESTDQVLQSNPAEALVFANTTTAMGGLTFDAAPGNSIELRVFLTPQPNKNFLFFVQDGKVNGNYQGSLTNPLVFEPTSP